MEKLYAAKLQPENRSQMRGAQGDLTDFLCTIIAMLFAENPHFVATLHLAANINLGRRIVTDQQDCQPRANTGGRHHLTSEATSARMSAAIFVPSRIVAGIRSPNEGLANNIAIIVHKKSVRSPCAPRI